MLSLCDNFTFRCSHVHLNVPLKELFLFCGFTLLGVYREALCTADTAISVPLFHSLPLQTALHSQQTGTKEINSFPFVYKQRSWGQWEFTADTAPGLFIIQWTKMIILCTFWVWMSIWVLWGIKLRQSGICFLTFVYLQGLKLHERTPNFIKWISYMTSFALLTYPRAFICNSPAVKGKGKGEFLPITGHEGPEREQMYSCTLPSTSALKIGVGDQLHAPAALPPRKTRYPLYRRLGGPPNRSGRVRKTSPHTGIRSLDRPARSQSLYRLSNRSPNSSAVRRQK